MLIYFYISGHGFGHASRDIELVNAIVAKRPETRFVARTAAPAWLFESARTPVDVQPLEADTGVAQIDSLHLDADETARRSATFYRDFERRVGEEAALLRRARADIVVADIPPLAFAAAAQAGVPSVAIGNFTWDWIYGAYPAFAAFAPEVVPTIQRAYAQANRALRLPLHGGFEPMTSVTCDIPFIARRSTRDPEDTRRLLGVPTNKPLVLASFGAYGVALPSNVPGQSKAFTLLTVERPPRGLGYQDVVAAADVVVSKPGYGIVSECVANNTALLYTSRGPFAEYDVFVAEMPQFLRCRYVPQEDLLAGRWAEAVEALLGQPFPPARPRVDGAEVAAIHLLALAPPET